MATETAPCHFHITLERPDCAFQFEAPADEYLLYAMQDAGIESPQICEQGWCLACAARLVAGEVDRSAALTNYPEDAHAGFVLLCSTKPRSNLVLTQDVHETPRDDAAPDRPQPACTRLSARCTRRLPARPCETGLSGAPRWQPPAVLQSAMPARQIVSCPQNPPRSRPGRA